MPATHATIEQLARTLGQRLPRRTALRAAAAILLGGAAGAAATAPAQAVTRRTVCRPDGGGCTRDAQCCIGHCRTSRDLPRAKRNRCGCPGGYGICGPSGCINLNTLDHCGGCDDACQAGLADACVNGQCQCGDDSACDDHIADACVSGACRCGDDPACALGTELCLSGVCVAGTCTLDVGAAVCIVDAELNVYQFAVDGAAAYNRCTASSECATFRPDCGSTEVCMCAAFYRTEPSGRMNSWGICAAYPAANQII